MSEQETKQMTAVFNCNLRSFPSNPHLVETAFGTAQIVGIGNAFIERDALEESNRDLLEALKAFVAEALLHPDGFMSLEAAEAAIRKAST